MSQTWSRDRAISITDCRKFNILGYKDIWQDMKNNVDSPELPAAVAWGEENVPSGVKISVAKRLPTQLSFVSTREK